MAKGDKPSLQMKIINRRLAPLSAYEEEVLCSYAEGAILTVEMHQKRSLPLLKKYWATLRDVVANCPSPWNSTEEASDALKLALGVTDIGKTVKGQWFIRPGSISFGSMDQAAFRDFYERAMAVLAEVTGLDPDALRSRVAHVPEEDQSCGSSEAAAPANDAGSGSGEASASSAADPSDAGNGVDEEEGAPASEPSRADCVKAFMMTATDPALSVEERRDLLAQMKDWWKESLSADLDFVRACLTTADKVAKSELGADAARRYLEGLL